MGTWLNRIAQGFFVLGLLLAAAKPLFRGNAVLTAAIGLAPAVAALLYIYAHTRAFLEQARQYDRMSLLFGNAGPACAGFWRKATWEAFQRLLLELGKEALRENGDWVLLAPRAADLRSVRRTRGFQPGRGCLAFVFGVRENQFISPDHPQAQSKELPHGGTPVTSIRA